MAHNESSPQARLRNFLLRGAFPHEFAWLIDNPVRRLFITPEALVARMAVATDAHVMELGPGSGYFSKALARAVPAGQLTLADLQEEMLCKARRKLRDGDGARTAFVACRAEDLPFLPGSFDAVVLVTVLGEVKRRDDCLSAIHLQLRDSGILVIHEHLPDPDFLRLSVLRRSTSAAGFRLRHRFGSLWNYTAVFSKC